MRALLLCAALLLQLAPATAAPPPGLGPLRPHQSPGWDERHHQAHYSRWSRLDTEHVLHKRQRGDPERTAIQHLFKREADGVFPRSVHDLEFHLAIRLLPRDQDLVEHKLNALHDPSHSSFRQYLDREETMRLLAQEALDLAYRFLSEHGIQESHVERTDDNQTLSFWVDIERANRMLNADFAVHKLIDRSRSDPASTPQRNALYQLGTKEYSLPQALAKYVGHINPGNDFRQVQPHVRPNTRVPDPTDTNRTMQSNAWNLRVPQGPPLVSGLTTCDSGMTPECLRAIYHMPIPADADTKGVSVATLNLRPYMSVPADLKAGFARYGGGRIPSSYLPEKIDIKVPGVSQSTDTPNPSEPDLDLEIMVPLVYPMTVYDYQAPSLSAMSLYGAVHQLGVGSYPRPDVLSVSYGAPECSFECEQYYCSMADAVALQGTTLVASSGDDGNQDIQDPGLCPYWVSASWSYSDKLRFYSNFAAGGWTFDSGGGFSTAYPPPEWQVSAIQEYTRKHNSNSFGRLQINAGVPDVAAQGKEFVIAITIDGQQEWFSYGGTSASTPVVSSLFALVNGVLKQNDRPMMGNPLSTFYTNTSLFRDVTSGNNNNDGVTGDWPALRGWDPASGLGTPLYNRILAHYLQA